MSKILSCGELKNSTFCINKSAFDKNATTANGLVVKKLNAKTSNKLNAKAEKANDKLLKIRLAPGAKILSIDNADELKKLLAEYSGKTIEEFDLKSLDSAQLDVLLMKISQDYQALEIKAGVSTDDPELKVVIGEDGGFKVLDKSILRNAEGDLDPFRKGMNGSKENLSKEFKEIDKEAHELKQQIESDKEKLRELAETLDKKATEQEKKEAEIAKVQIENNKILREQVHILNQKVKEINEKNEELNNREKALNEEQKQLKEAQDKLKEDERELNEKYNEAQQDIADQLKAAEDRMYRNYDEATQKLEEKKEQLHKNYDEAKQKIEDKQDRMYRNYDEAKQKIEDIKQDARDSMNERERDLNSREQVLDSRERNLDSRAQGLNSRAQNLDSVANNLKMKEQNLDSREQGLNSRAQAQQERTRQEQERARQQQAQMNQQQERMRQEQERARQQQAQMRQEQERQSRELQRQQQENEAQRRRIEEQNKRVEAERENLRRESERAQRELNQAKKEKEKLKSEQAEYVKGEVVNETRVNTSNRGNEKRLGQVVVEAEWQEVNNSFNSNFKNPGGGAIPMGGTPHQRLSGPTKTYDVAVTNTAKPRNNNSNPNTIQITQEQVASVTAAAKASGLTNFSEKDVAHCMAQYNHAISNIDKTNVKNQVDNVKNALIVNTSTKTPALNAPKVNKSVKSMNSESKHVVKNAASKIPARTDSQKALVTAVVATNANSSKQANSVSNTTYGDCSVSKLQNSQKQLTTTGNNITPYQKSNSLNKSNNSGYLGGSRDANRAKMNHKASLLQNALALRNA